MPRYEYVCERCGYEFEVQAKVGDPNPLCPKFVAETEPVEPGNLVKTKVLTCGGPTRKLISKSSFQLLGGGWAADGYSSGGGSTSKE